MRKTVSAGLILILSTFNLACKKVANESETASNSQNTIIASDDVGCNGKVECEEFVDKFLTSTSHMNKDQVVARTVTTNKLMVDITRPDRGYHSWTQVTYSGVTREEFRRLRNSPDHEILRVSGP